MVLSKNVDEQYHALLQKILNSGTKKTTRSGDVISIFGEQMRFKLGDGFPLLTTKKMFTKGVIHELLWFLNGDTNIKYLIDNDVHIWDDDAYRWYKTLIEKHNAILGSLPTGISVIYHVKDEEYNLSDAKYLAILSKEEFIEKVKNSEELYLGCELCYVNMLNIHQINFKAYKFGDLGDVYGTSWRCFGTSKTDQIQNIINTLKNNPDDRRMLCVNYNPDVIGTVALAPCHIIFQFYTRELSINERWELYYDKFKDEPMNENNFSQPHLEIYGLSSGFQYNGEYDNELEKENVPIRELSCSFYCRSQDVPLGTPFNVASYALLTHMIAQVCNMSVGDLIYNGGDCHIYSNQIDGVKEQLSRDCNTYERPRLILNPDIKEIEDFKFDDIKIENYQSYPSIKYPLSVG